MAAMIEIPVEEGQERVAISPTGNLAIRQVTLKDGRVVSLKVFTRVIELEVDTTKFTFDQLVEQFNAELERLV